MMPDCEVSAYSVFNGVVKSEEIPSLDGGDEPPFRDNIEEENDENGGISVIEFIVESENSRD
ncbi:MAG: hypothetical protein EA353_09955 [Puniceicoccaceae bacterium]|nr:MAG: hypothetical protein EA353_09955 [Puniceicoccaceae bacterium]